MPRENLATMQRAHKILAEMSFDLEELEKGYANRYLKVDLDALTISIHPVTQQMKDLWVGGKGFDLWLTFQEINEQTDWDSPENPICFSSGPLGGTTSFPGSGKTIVTAISPLTHNVMDCNVGGYFGPYLKFAGFDAMVVVGKSAEETLLLIDAVNRKITLETAPQESIDSHILAEELTEMYADDEIDKRNIAVISAGRGAEHTHMGVLNFSFYDWRREVARLKQAGRGGIGTVFRDKKLKAIVAKTKGVNPAWRIQENKVAKMIEQPKTSSCQCQNEVEIIDEIIAKWKSNPEFAIEMMQDIQERFRCISSAAIDRINKFTGTPKAQLYHIATFYKAFSLDEKGETTIQVCTGTACHVKGSAKLIDTFERELGIRCGKTTSDKKFTLEAVACLGACSIAPVVKIGEKVYGGVQSNQVSTMIQKAKEEEK